MDDSRRTGLASEVPSPMSEARKARQWHAIGRAVREAEARGARGAKAPVSRPTRRRWIWPAVALVNGVAAVAAMALALWPSGPAHLSRDGVELAAGGEPLELELWDGSQMTVGRDAAVSVLSDRAESQVIEVRRGTAWFDVVHNDDRVFEVRAADVSVHVVGTRFSVSREDTAGTPSVTVSVSEGRVRVRQGNGEPERILAAGEALTTVVRFEEARVTESPASGEESAVGELAGLEPAALEATTEPRGEPVEPRRPRTHREPAPDADTLFASALRVQREGGLREAADLYAQFLRAHPRDPRAGMAAFELGRLRLDSLHDARGAVAAFRIAIARRGPHREDALARLVEAHERAGQRGDCGRARARYLREFPDGVHAHAVERRCRQ